MGKENIKRYKIGTYVDGELIGKEVVLASDYDALVERMEKLEAELQRWHATEGRR